jgi:hypothetical protein
MSTLPRKRWGAGLVLSIAPLVLPLVSCAEVTIRKATENAEGLRFYRPAPYLQVSEAADKRTAGRKVVALKPHVSSSPSFGCPTTSRNTSCGATRVLGP